MARFFALVSLGPALLGLAACGGAPAPVSSPGAKPVAPHDYLRRIVDRYWDERVPPGIALSPQFEADSLAIERRFLAEILTVPRDRLDADAKLNYDIFKSRRELAVEGFTFPSELLPIEPFDAMPWQFERAAADTQQRPLAGAAEYEGWLLQADGFVKWTRQAILNMREGVRRGYTSPRGLMERTLPMLQSLGTDTSANVFYVLLRTMPESVKEPQRSRLSARVAGAIKDKVLPAYRELHDFIQSEYLPRARRSMALSALPLGPSWYAYRVKRATGTRLTPKEIHNIGLAEVDRLRARMLALPQGAPPAVEVNLADAYQELKAQTLAAMPALFSAFPEADFEIVAGPGADTAPLTYRRATPKGGTPAILFVNLNPGGGQPAHLEVAEFLQEAIPGRHYQDALQQERTDLPKFRRFASDPAFVDGWALYAATLGDDLSLYRDDEAKRGVLLEQLKCAVALVVDTGVHAMDWTRTQAADYLVAQLALEGDAAGSMLDRFVALPADALACEVGELEFQALRNRAKQTLRDRFDIREFHTEILKDGAMPLEILEEKMQLWMETKR